ncbi:hypothetical protein [Frateuria defendens]|uniref:hypothetical protein n=1 Tax=Frateuria defendens TaxID=2219559 RepID=UPI0007DBF369|nr:hypothetical protein [Frateuria defendens]
MDWAALASALQDSAFAGWVRSSPAVYPLANLLHLLGMAALVGGIGLLDLRLLGLGRGIAPAALARLLVPIGIGAVVLMLVSGFTLFAADAGTLVHAPRFRWKLLLIALALGNALAFEWLWRGKLPAWTDHVPAGARAMAAASLGLWLTVATLGRLIAYG